MKGVILAAGRGEKAAPYSLSRPKPMIPVGNKPIVRHILEGFRAAGISEVVVVLGYLGQQVRGYIESVKDEFNFDVRYAYQSEPTGTADALLKAMEYTGDDSLLVAYGDVVAAPENYVRLVDVFEKNRFAVVTVSRRIHSSDLAVDVEDSGRVRALRWWGGGRFRVAGLFGFSVEALKYVECNPGVMRSSSVGVMPPLEAELAQSVDFMAASGRTVAAVEVEGYYEDVDFPWSILHANMEYYEYMASRLKENILRRDARISSRAKIKAPVYVGEGSYIGDGVVVSRPLFMGRDSHIDNGVVVEGGMVGDNTILENYCYVKAVVGSHVRIGHAAEVFGVVFDRTHIVHYSEVAGVIGENVDIGAATVVGTLRFDSEKQTVVVKGKRFKAESVAFIGDYCRTGVNATIMPGVRVGPYSVVGPGVVLYEDLEPGKMILVKQEYVKRDWGPHRYGW